MDFRSLRQGTRDLTMYSWTSGVRGWTRGWLTKYGEDRGESFRQHRFADREGNSTPQFDLLSPFHALGRERGPVDLPVRRCQRFRLVNMAQRLPAGLAATKQRPNHRRRRREEDFARTLSKTDLECLFAGDQAGHCGRDRVLKDYGICSTSRSRCGLIEPQTGRGPVR